jgi:sorting nexin-29
LSDSLNYLHDRHDGRSYFAALKQIFGAVKPAGGKFIKNLDSSIAKTDCDIYARWNQHFYNLFNNPVVINMEELSKILPVQSEVQSDLDRNFNVYDIYKAVVRMNQDKACGNNGMPIEFMQFLESEFLIPKFLEVINMCLALGEVPSEFKDVIVAVLFKKGDKMMCDNYRGLSLINHDGKLFERLIMDRIVEFTEQFLPESQNGFRANRSTVDSSFTSRLLSSMAKEKCVNIFKCFVDLTKAYDKVDRNVLWLVLERRGFPPKLIALIKALHVGAMAQVRIDSYVGEAFELLCGLKQGACFSPLLFNIFFGAIIDAFHDQLQSEGVALNYRLGGDIFNLTQLKATTKCNQITITELLFADDAELVATSEVDLQRMVMIFSNICSIFGQEVSIKKTEVLVVQSKNNGKIIPKIEINGRTLAVVDDFKYVGSKENDHANMDVEIGNRIQSMKVAYAKLRVRIFENRHITLIAKWKLYCSMVRVSGTYACAAWNTTQKHLDKLESTQYRIILSFLGYTWINHRSYLDLIIELAFKSIEFKPIEAIIRKTRLIYAGHVERMDNSRHEKKVMHAELANGVRRSGGVQTAWRHSLKSDLEAFGIDTKTWQILCQCRSNWRRLVDKGENRFIKNWYKAKEQESIKRHECDSIVSCILNDVVSNIVNEIAVDIVGEIRNGIIVVDAVQPEIFLVVPTVSPIVLVDNFDLIDNAVNDKGRILTGRGLGGYGSTVCIGRGRNERKRNQKKFDKCIPSRASRIFHELKGSVAHKQNDTNVYCVCQEQPLEDGIELYIVCSSCDQSYHAKCINYNVVNNHAVMKSDYYCGYCTKSKSWPHATDRPPLIHQVIPAAVVIDPQRTIQCANCECSRCASFERVDDQLWCDSCCRARIEGPLTINRGKLSHGEVWCGYTFQDGDGGHKPNRARDRVQGAIPLQVTEEYARRFRLIN